MSLKRPMAAIAAIGTELTLGRSRESNSEHLARWLGRLGFEVRAVIKLPDDPEVVAGELRHALASAELLITTGGLGATHDDITREALAALLGKPLLLDKGLAEIIKARVPTGADRRRFMSQAHLPEGATAIEPIPGTAPGIAADFQGRPVFALPGVPAEMKAMLEAVGRALEERFGRLPGMTAKQLKIAGAPEPVIAGLIDRIILDHPEIGVNILAKPEEIRLTLIAETGSEDEVEQMVSELSIALGDFLYGEGDETMSAVVGKLLGNEGLTIGVAESITAGQISAEIAATPGSSKYLLGAIVAYGNDAKERLLNVSHETLAAAGAVSPEAAKAMAEGARRALKADLGLAVTGIAGPGGGTPDKPVGLVYVGLTDEKGSEAAELRLKGDRGAIQRRTTAAALNMLRLFLLGRSSA